MTFKLVDLSLRDYMDTKSLENFNTKPLTSDDTNYPNTSSCTMKKRSENINIFTLNVYTKVHPIFNILTSLYWVWHLKKNIFLLTELTCWKKNKRRVLDIVFLRNFARRKWNITVIKPLTFRKFLQYFSQTEFLCLKFL